VAAADADDVQDGFGDPCMCRQCRQIKRATPQGSPTTVGEYSQQRSQCAVGSAPPTWTSNQQRPLFFCLPTRPGRRPDRRAAMARTLVGPRPRADPWIRPHVGGGPRRRRARGRHDRDRPLLGRPRRLRWPTEEAVTAFRAIGPRRAGEGCPDRRCAARVPARRADRGEAIVVSADAKSARRS